MITPRLFLKFCSFVRFNVVFSWQKKNFLARAFRVGVSLHGFFWNFAVYPRESGNWYNWPAPVEATKTACAPRARHSDRGNRAARRLYSLATSFGLRSHLLRGSLRTTSTTRRHLLVLLVPPSLIVFSFPFVLFLCPVPSSRLLFLRAFSLPSSLPLLHDLSLSSSVAPSRATLTSPLRPPCPNVFI